MYWKPKGIKADITVDGEIPSTDNLVTKAINGVKSSISELSHTVNESVTLLKKYNSRIRRFKESGEGDITLLTEKLGEMGFTITKSGYISSKGFMSTYTTVGASNLDMYVPSETEKWKTDVAPRLNAEKQAKAKASFEVELKNKLSKAFDELLGEYYEYQEEGDRVVHSDLTNALSDEELYYLEKDMMSLGRAYRNKELSVEEIWEEVKRIRGMKGVY